MVTPNTYIHIPNFLALIYTSLLTYVHQAFCFLLFTETTITHGVNLTVEVKEINLTVKFPEINHPQQRPRPKTFTPAK